MKANEPCPLCGEELSIVANLPRGLLYHHPGNGCLLSDMMIPQSVVSKWPTHPLAAGKHQTHELPKDYDEAADDGGSDLVNSKQSRYVILPEVSEEDRKTFADGLHDVFLEWANIDREVGLNGMTEGEARLADAIMKCLEPETAAATTDLHNQGGGSVL